MIELRGLDFTEEEKQKAREENKLLTLSIFMDSGCNLKCKYCFTNAGKKSKNNLSLEEYKRIISEAKELGAKTVLIAGYGEPLLDEKLLPIIKYTTELDMTTVFFTNNIMITKEVAKTLYENNCSVITKLNSFEGGVQDYLSGVPGSFKKISTGRENLIEAGFNKTNPTRLGIETVVTKQNKDEIKKIVNFAIENNISVFPETMIMKGRALENWENIGIESKEAKKIFNKLPAEFKNYFSGGCDLDQYTVFIKQDGELQQCLSRDFVKIGNVRENSLGKLWGSTIMKQIRSNANCAECNKECAGRIYYKINSLGKLRKVAPIKLENCKSKIVQQNNNLIYASLYRGFRNTFKRQGYKTNLGKELCNKVKELGNGGFFTTDELPGYGMNKKELDKILNTTNAGSNDCVLLYAYDKRTSERCDKYLAECLLDKVKNQKGVVKL